VNTFWLFLLIAYSGFIFYLSHQPSLPVPVLFLHQDKLFHATAYGGLAFLAIHYFKYQCHSFDVALKASLIFCVLYGLSDEWHQSFVQGRHADALDWLADCLGAVLVLACFRAVSKQNKFQS